jgi:hypothetical protein
VKCYQKLTCSAHTPTWWVVCFARQNYWLPKRSLAPWELQPADFKRVEDWAVDQAVALQEETGFEIVTGGVTQRMPATVYSIGPPAWFSTAADSC